MKLPSELGRNRALLITGHIFCLIWIFLCCWFYKERTLYIDSANQIFQMINSGHFSVFDRRYPMIINELLPMAAIKLQMSLRSIVFLYAVSFAIITYGIYLINVYIFRSLAAGLVIIFGAASIGAVFFHGISETVQLIAYSALLYGWLEYLAKRNFKIPLFVNFGITLIILALCFFIHPVSVFFIIFILGFFYFDHQLYRHWYVYTLTLLLLALVVIELLTIPTHSHNASFFSQLANYREIIPTLWHSYPVSFFFIHYFSYYFLPTLALLAVIIKYLRKKQFFKLAFVLGSIAVFLLISLIIYHQGDADHAMERTFLPLAFFCGLPFLKDIVVDGSGRLKRLGVPLLILLILWGLNNILQSGKIFSNRLDELKSYVEQADNRGGSKFIVKAENINTSALVIRYLFSTETLLYSSLNGPENSKTIFISDSVLDSTKLKNDADLFLFTNYYLYRDQSILNPHYFHISGFYKTLYGKRHVSLSITCDAEKIGENANQLVGSNGMMFNFQPPRDSTSAYSGKYSVATGENARFGFSALLPDCHTSDQWEISVKRKGNKDASLVVSDGASLYIRAMTPDSTDASGWQTLKLSFIVSNNMKMNNIKVYVWNPSPEVTYFDDLKLVKSSLSKN